MPISGRLPMDVSLVSSNTNILYVKTMNIQHHSTSLNPQQTGKCHPVVLFFCVFQPGESEYFRDNSDLFVSRCFGPCDSVFLTSNESGWDCVIMLILNMSRMLHCFRHDL